MASNPKIAPQVEVVLEKKIMQVSEPKPVGSKQRVRDLLVDVFAGHQDFLGWTPD
jgi:hypothetical protein